MALIFVSYRRADSQSITDRIYEHLARAFGPQNVFKDVDDIPAGSDFRQVILQTINECPVVLVIIGQQWLNMPGTDGRRRLDNPSDYVRLEIEAALMSRRWVIPVMVNNAKPVYEAALPRTLGQLAYNNALHVRNDPDFQWDIQNLIEALTRILESSVPGFDRRHMYAQDRARRRQRRRSRGLVWGGVVGLISLLVAGFLLVGRGESGGLKPSDYFANPAADLAGDQLARLEVAHNAAENALVEYPQRQPARIIDGDNSTVREQQNRDIFSVDANDNYVRVMLRRDAFTIHSPDAEAEYDLHRYDDVPQVRLVSGKTFMEKGDWSTTYTDFVVEDLDGNTFPLRLMLPLSSATIDLRPGGEVEFACFTGQCRVQDLRTGSTRPLTGGYQITFSAADGDMLTAPQERIPLETIAFYDDLCGGCITGYGSPAPRSTSTLDPDYAATMTAAYQPFPTWPDTFTPTRTLTPSATFTQSSTPTRTPYAQLGVGDNP